jgi:hypothetical protein
MMGVAKTHKGGLRLRLKGQVKMGYYPTPDSVVQLIRPRLVFPQEPFAALDPCCGTGVALKDLVKGSRAVTYGIELDLERAREATGTLDSVAKGAFELAKVPKNAFGLMLLNPPYDWETGSEENSRKEYKFLRDASPALVSGGILVYIIPQNRFGRTIARYLDYAFDRISVARFPDKEYERFGQVVVVARKKSVKSTSEASFTRLLSFVTSADLPVLGDIQDVWEVPATQPRLTIEGVACFPEEAERVAQASTVLDALRQSVVPSPQAEMRGQPPTPLHKGHISLLLAAGHLDGYVGEGPDTHLVRGTVTKEEREISSEETDAGEETHTLITHRITIKCLTPQGTIKTLA